MDGSRNQLLKLLRACLTWRELGASANRATLAEKINFWHISLQNALKRLHARQGGGGEGVARDTGADTFHLQPQYKLLG